MNSYFEWFGMSLEDNVYMSLCTAANYLMQAVVHLAQSGISDRRSLSSFLIFLHQYNKSPIKELGKKDIAWKNKQNEWIHEHCKGRDKIFTLRSSACLPESNYLTNAFNRGMSKREKSALTLERSERQFDRDCWWAPWDERTVTHN